MSPRIICVKEINKECRCPLCVKEKEEEKEGYASLEDYKERGVEPRDTLGMTEMYRGIK